MPGGEAEERPLDKIARPEELTTPFTSDRKPEPPDASDLAVQLFEIVRDRKDLLDFLDRLAVEYDRDGEICLPGGTYASGATEEEISSDRTVADHIRGMMVDPDDTGAGAAHQTADDFPGGGPA